MPATKHPLLVGYYGEHNLGDDALLEVLLSQLPVGCVPIVTVHDQPQIETRFGVSTVNRRSLATVLITLRRCSALVLGGGSLLQDSTSFASLLYYAALITTAWAQGKPVLLWGQGLGPLARRRSRLVVSGLLRLATVCSWRDPASATLAMALGWRPQPGQLAAGVGTDPVWAARAMPWRGLGGPVVLCWRPVSQLHGTQWLPWLAALEQLAPDRELLWLPFHGAQDQGLPDRLAAEGLLSPALDSRSREVLVEQPHQAMEVFQTAGLVLSMRLHGLILAAVSGAPVAALSYDPKVSAAAQALGCPCSDLEGPPPADLAQRWSGCLDRPADPERVQGLRAGTDVHKAVLSSLC